MQQLIFDESRRRRITELSPSARRPGHQAGRVDRPVVSPERSVQRATSRCHARTPYSVAREGLRTVEPWLSAVPTGEPNLARAANLSGTIRVVPMGNRRSCAAPETG